MKDRRLFNVTVVTIGLMLLGGCSEQKEGIGAGDAGPANDVLLDVDEGGDDLDATRDAPPEGDTDVRHQDGFGAKPDVRLDAERPEVDGGADSGEMDSDYDGLTNAQEANLCEGKGSDPYDSDTDDDGLSDYKEFKVGTSACKADTDGDGATDAEELKWGLNPTTRSTFDDGVVDGNRWILDACEGQTPGAVDFHENGSGNWSLALPTAFSNYENVTITSGRAPLAAAVYDDTTNEVAGFTLSQSNPTSASSPEETLARSPTGSVLQSLQSVATIDQDLVQGEYETHDKYLASTGEYEVSVDGSGISVRKFREDLLLELAPFTEGEVSGLPNSSGATYTKFKVVLTVVFRANTNGRDQRIVTAAIAPLAKTIETDPSYNRYVPIRLDDLTNTTNLAEQVDTSKDECLKFTADSAPPKANFYWVLDHSVSMDADNSTVKEFSGTFEDEVTNTSLEYQLGVTTMQPTREGRLNIPPGWHTGPGQFASEVQSVIDEGGATEAGLTNALHGIRHMSGGAPTPPSEPEKIGEETKVITIFMSDENADAPRYGDWAQVNEKGVSGIQSVQDFTAWFRPRTTAFAIVTNGGECDGDNAKAYREVALGTGGKTADLCSEDLTQTIQDIIFAATGIASNFNPKPVPISSSLKVFLNGEYVPRSENDGYAYFSNQNAVSFFGQYRPEPEKADNPDIAPDRLAIVYETWQDECKEDDQGAFNCASGSGSP